MLADVVADIVLVPQDESYELRWVPASAVVTLPLHPGFALTWPVLQARVVAATDEGRPGRASASGFPGGCDPRQPLGQA